METPARSCAQCGTALAAAQDWCLECGTAQPGRLSPSGLPGFRAAATIIGVVLLLVGGAVAASYAALNSKAEQTAAAPPAASAEPAAPVTVPATTATVPTTPTTTPAAPPATAKAPTPAPAPPAPVKTSTPAATPAPSAPSTPTPKARPEPTGPAAEPGYQPLSLGVDAASLYDPYKSADDSTDPADSYDLDDKTVFEITTAAGKDMAVGLDFDLETAREVAAVYLRTTTPGFGVEIYGAKGVQPPDILDNRWRLLARRKDAGTQAGKNGLEKITFDPGRYRHVVLWFTTPPPSQAADGTATTSTTPPNATVGIAEVRILD